MATRISILNSVAVGNAQPLNVHKGVFLMDFGLNAEQKMIKESVRKFAAEQIIPHARDRDHAGKFPRDLLYKMGELGLSGRASARRVWWHWA